jgi:hypothetical protein
MARKPRKTPRAPKIDPKDTCFVIMPFGGFINEYYSAIYKPAIEANNLVPRRADDLFRPSTIVNDIWNYTKHAKILLADLTGKNANVFYELGLAHALAKPVIMVAESMDDIPFDLRALRIIVYDKNVPDWGDVLQKKIEASIMEVLRSPADAVLPTFLDVKGAGQRPTVTPQEKEIIEIRQEVDSLRRELLLRREPDLRNREPIRTADEAKLRIELLIQQGLAPASIVETLKTYGVAENWTRGRIAEIIGRRLQTRDIRRVANLRVKSDRAQPSKKARKKRPPHR